MAKKPKKSKRFIYNLKSVLKFREIKEKQEQEKLEHQSYVHRVLIRLLETPYI